MGVFNCSMFCCTLLYVHSSIAIISMGKKELVTLLNLSFWCLVMVEWLFLAVPWGCLRFVIVVFPDHTHLLLFCRLILLSRQRAFISQPTYYFHGHTFDTWLFSNIGLKHVLSCITPCRAQVELFEHECSKPSVQTSPEKPGKCKCNETNMNCVILALLT